MISCVWLHMRNEHEIQKLKCKNAGFVTSSKFICLEILYIYIVAILFNRKSDIASTICMVTGINTHDISFETS